VGFGGLFLQVFDLLEEFERACCEFLGRWEGGYVDSVGGAVVARFGLGHGWGVERVDWREVDGVLFAFDGFSTW
jgi:hypothetical protein